MTSPVDRVAVAAQNVKPLRLLLSILAFPFYALGLLVGFVVVLLSWAYASALVGFDDARNRGGS